MVLDYCRSHYIRKTRPCSSTRRKIIDLQVVVVFPTNINLKGLALHIYFVHTSQRCHNLYLLHACQVPNSINLQNVDDGKETASLCVFNDWKLCKPHEYCIEDKVTLWQLWYMVLRTGYVRRAYRFHANALVSMELIVDTTSKAMKPSRTSASLS